MSITATAEAIVLSLDSTISLNEWIGRGNYGNVDDYYSEPTFTLVVSLTLTGQREVIFYNPNRFVSSEEMIDRMKADGCVPATLDDALAIGAQFPEQQTRRRIVFLGTPWADPNYEPYSPTVVPVLDNTKKGRVLGLYWSEGGWSSECRFAAVREPKGQAFNF